MYRYVILYEYMKNGVQAHNSALYSTRDLASDAMLAMSRELVNQGFTVIDSYVERIK